MNRAENGTCVALAAFTTAFVLQVPGGLPQRLLELLAPIVILSLAWVLTAALPAVDRILILGTAGLATSFAVHQTILEFRGEASPALTQLLSSTCRYGIGCAMIAYAALFSASRSGAQYAYNVIVVGAVSFFAGCVLDNLITSAPAMCVGGLLAFLEGGATGSAFSLATLDARALEAPATQEKP